MYGTVGGKVDHPVGVKALRKMNEFSDYLSSDSENAQNLMVR